MLLARRIQGTAGRYDGSFGHHHTIRAVTQLSPLGEIIAREIEAHGPIPFSRSIALQYAKQGIRSNCILPGLMNTPLIFAGLPDAYAKGDAEEMVRLRDAQCPTGKMGDAWDVAHAALYLASDEAKYVNGVQLAVDGGLTCKIV